MKYFFTILIMLFSFSCYAENRIAVNLTSIHFQNQPPASTGIDEYCTNNFGFGAEHHFNDNVYVSAGMYNNSYCERTEYITGGIGGILLDDDFIKTRLALEVGLASGYDKYKNSLTKIDFSGDNAIFGGLSLSLEGQQNVVKFFVNPFFVGVQYQYRLVD